MPDTTPNLSLPFLLASQSDKHVTLNQSLSRLDSLVQLRVASMTTTREPITNLTEGIGYILPPGAVGPNWPNYPIGSVIVFLEGAWQVISPRPGWMATVADSGKLIRYLNGQWDGFTAGELSLGSASAAVTGVSGRALGFLDTANTWSATQKFALNVPITFQANDIALEFRNQTGSRTSYVRKINNDQLCIENEQPGAAIDLVTSAGGPLRFNYQKIFFAAESLIPATDNFYTLGTSTRRYSVLYSATGIINTSDQTEKSPFQSLSPALLRAGRKLVDEIGTFQWLSSIDQKGESAARWHIGLKAQTVLEVFRSEGLDPWKFGMVCNSGFSAEERTEPSQPMLRHSSPDTVEPDSGLQPSSSDKDAHLLGVRYEQIIMLMLASIASQPDFQ